MNAPLSVLGFGYVAPHAREAAVEGAGGVGAELERVLPALDLALLERTLRRGLSEVTRLFMHVAKLALSDAAADPASRPERVHVIFASAFGEIATAEALLAEAYDENGSSPARFRHSVHNTAPGLLSISVKNHLPCTAVAAGWETVAMGLFEAAAQLATDAERVLLVFAEERVPAALSREHNHGSLAAALVLGRDESARKHARATLSLPRRCSREAQGDQHPLAPVLALARMFEQGASGTLAVSDGDTPWCVQLAMNEAAS